MTPVFGVGDEGLGLLARVLRRQVGVRLAAAIADGGLLQHIAEVIHFQRHGVGHSRVLGLAFVVVTDGLAGMGEKHTMAVIAARLQVADGEILFGDGVRMLRLVRCHLRHRLPAAAWRL